MSVPYEPVPITTAVVESSLDPDVVVAALIGISTLWFVTSIVVFVLARKVKRLRHHMIHVE